MAESPLKDTLLRPDEVAELLRTSEGTLGWWRHVGKGPRSFRIGRRVFYAQSEVERWLREQMDAAS